MTTGENVVCFSISKDGKINYAPDFAIVSTSHEMELVIREIAPKVAVYFERLLKESGVT